MEEATVTVAELAATEQPFTAEELAVGTTWLEDIIDRATAKCIR